MLQIGSNIFERDQLQAGRCLHQQPTVNLYVTGRACGTPWPRRAASRL